jgi:TetR/AcrR family transcriptional regulator
MSVYRAKRDPSSTPKRNAERTRKAILKAARKDFSEKGLAGARVRDIAHRAGVNKAMIYHYFADKDALYLAVLEAAFDDIRRRERSLQLEHLEPVESITRLIDFTLDFLVRNPDWVALINNENLHGGVHLKQSTAVTRIIPPLVDMIDDILRRGREQGVFRADIDPTRLYVSIAGQCYFYVSNRHTLSTLFGHDLMAKTAVEAFRRHVIDITLSGLKI